MNRAGGSIQHDRASRVWESSAAKSDVSDATSHAGSGTTCPDGQRTSTYTVAAAMTVTGTNLGGDGFAKGRFLARDFAGDEARDGESITVDKAKDASRSRSSRFQK